MANEKPQPQMSFSSLHARLDLWSHGGVVRVELAGPEGRVSFDLPLANLKRAVNQLEDSDPR